VLTLFGFAQSFIFAIASSISKNNKANSLLKLSKEDFLKSA
jgi:hypothetical protein